MAKFLITALDPRMDTVVPLLYDNMDSSLTDLKGQSVIRTVDPALQAPHPVAPVTSRDAPLGKTSPRILKISLGLSCNYACEYCSQRFVARNDETNPDDVTGFMESLDSWVLSPPEAIEFWGGEPLVYIKTLRPLAEALRLKFPQARFSVITNGSLLNPQINHWLDDLGFTVSISHDGPGQHVRGPDPLEDPLARQAILELYRRLAPEGRFSFNAMVNRSNQSRAAIQAFFDELTGDPDVMIGEGGFVDAYDDGGRALSLKPDEFHAFRRVAFQEIRHGHQQGHDGKGDRGQVPLIRRHRDLHNTLRQRNGLAWIGDPALHQPDSCWPAHHHHRPQHDSLHDDVVRNNVWGTRVCAEAAARNGVRNFVLISTDKAVRPTNIMGATKRLSDWVQKKIEEKLASGRR